jgi:4-hydroxybenzoate polyprenyltransferase
MNNIIQNPYFQLLRLHSPAPIFLLLSPCLFSLALDAANFYYYILFAVGAFIMRPAGCIINDIADKDFDKNVERTKNRPIASGKISVKNAIITLTLLLFVGLLILIQLNLYAIIIALCAIPLMFIYPLMKRFTFMPQLFLAITYNMGALIAGAAITGHVTLVHILIYIGCIFWTLGYDTIYAYQDIKDDQLIGVKSTALLFGDLGKWWIENFYKLTIIFLLAAALLADVNLNFLFGIFCGFAIYILYWQIKTLDLEDSANCKKRFDSNMLFGLVLALAFIFGKISIIFIA